MVCTDLLFHLKLELINHICLLTNTEQAPLELVFLKLSKVFLYFQASKKASICNKLKSFSSGSNKLAGLRFLLLPSCLKPRREN